jgi:large subunit ribosomal protein L23
VITERMYNILREPHATEKVSRVGESSNQYAFRVSVDATKAEIKSAIENIFKVTVLNVTTLNVKGKQKRTMRGISRKNDWKKAYVRLAQGQELDPTSVE